MSPAAIGAAAAQEGTATADTQTIVVSPPDNRPSEHERRRRTPSERPLDKAFGELLNSSIVAHILLPRGTRKGSWARASHGGSCDDDR